MPNQKLLSQRIGKTIPAEYSLEAIGACKFCEVQQFVTLTETQRNKRISVVQFTFNICGHVYVENLITKQWKFLLKQSKP